MLTDLVKSPSPHPQLNYLVLLVKNLNLKFMLSVWPVHKDCQIQTVDASSMGYVVNNDKQIMLVMILLSILWVAVNFELQ